MSDAGQVAGPAGSGLGDDERAELERLRKERVELERLRAEAARPPRRHIGWRTPVATIFIVIGCLLAPVSVVAVWAGNQVTNTSRFVENVEPLIHDPAIQNALTDRITYEITTRLNVAGYANQAAAALTSKGLPRVGTLLKTFAPSIASAVTGFIHGQVHKIVTSPQFAKLWVRATTYVHQRLVNVLSGHGPTSVSVSNGQVVLGLGSFIDLVKQDLVKRGFTLVSKIPSFNPTLTLFSAKYLVKAQTVYRRVNNLKIVLPILTLLLLAIGVYIARGHRRALIGAGLGLAVSMLIPAAGLQLFRGIYLNSVPSNVLPADAAAVLYDTLIRFLKDGLRLVLVVGLVVAAGAFLVGPSITAVRIRSGFTSGLGWLRHSGERVGVRTGPVGEWVYASRRALRIAAVGLALLIFVFLGRPTAASVIVIAVLLLVVLGLIELIGSSPPPAAETGITAGP